jgi:hypothetical protein
MRAEKRMSSSGGDDEDKLNLFTFHQFEQKFGQKTQRGFQSDGGTENDLEEDQRAQRRKSTHPSNDLGRPQSKIPGHKSG